MDMIARYQCVENPEADRELVIRRSYPMRFIICKQKLFNYTKSFRSPVFILSEQIFIHLYRFSSFSISQLHSFHISMTFKINFTNVTNLWSQAVIIFLNYKVINIVNETCFFLIIRVNTSPRYGNSNKPEFKIKEVVSKQLTFYLFNIIPIWLI